jgi:hypothetical protein
LRFNKAKWEAGSHFFRLANQAAAPGLVRTSCDSLKELAGQVGGSPVCDDEVCDITAIPFPLSLFLN